MTNFIDACGTSVIGRGRQIVHGTSIADRTKFNSLANVTNLDPTDTTPLCGALRVIRSYWICCGSIPVDALI